LVEVSRPRSDPAVRAQGDNLTFEFNRLEEIPPKGPSDSAAATDPVELLRARPDSPARARIDPVQSSTLVPTVAHAVEDEHAEVPGLGPLGDAMVGLTDPSSGPGYQDGSEAPSVDDAIFQTAIVRWLADVAESGHDE
jgi:hypothetical protein